MNDDVLDISTTPKSGKIKLQKEINFRLKFLELQAKM